ncbi:MAG: DNA polymerase III subunit chi [Legionellales bacterium]|nr:DNA polymerase III subunit chi [Legionellales bacterium]
MSVRVDFYVLAQANAQAGWIFACRLAEKAHKQKQKLYVYCTNHADTERFDDLLWTFDDAAFVPHLLESNTSTDSFAPIRIGENAPENPYPIILNLSNTVPSFYTQSERVIEIVFGDEAQRAATRERFRTYRNAGCDLHTHQMDKY